jgi:hypothetical protein
MFGDTLSAFTPAADNTYTYIANVASDRYDSVLRVKDVAGASFSFSSFQLVDLTQYFNGDTTLINSITSWDDLVAYDLRFASYVEYNTGTVEGAQPSVYVGSPNLFNIANLAGATNISISGTTITLNATNIASGKTLKQLVPSVKAGDVLYLSFGGTTTNKYIWLANGDAGSQWTNNSYHTVKDNEVNTSVKFYCGEAGQTITNMMISLAPLSTYEPYHDGETATSPSELFAVGTAADEFEAVAGVTTRKMVSYTFTGQETWTLGTSSGVSYNSYYCNINNKKKGLYNLIIAGFVTSSANLWTSLNDKECIGANSNTSIFIKNDAWTTPEQVAQGMAGKTIYYELATPTTSTSTPTQISLQAGSNTAMQTDGGRLADIDVTYESNEI